MGEVFTGNLQFSDTYYFLAGSILSVVWIILFLRIRKQFDYKCFQQLLMGATFKAVFLY